MSSIAPSLLAVLVLSLSAGAASAQEAAQPPPPPADAQPIYPPSPPPGEPPPPVTRSAPAASAPAANARTSQEHHRGFYFRADTGIGYLGSKITENGNDLTVSGAAFSLNFALGGSIAHNQILAFHLWDLVAGQPTFNSGGVSTTFSSDTSFGVIGIGPQYTIYSQQNFYLSLTPSLTRLIETTNNQSTQTDWGFGVHAAVGKEWWVSRNWGLGLAGQLIFSANQDNGSGSPVWVTWGAGLAFSATYN